MPIVLTDDLQKLVLDKAAEFTDSLNNQFREAGSSTPTSSSDSLTNPLGTGNAPAPSPAVSNDTATPDQPVSLPAPDAPVTAPLTAPQPAPNAPVTAPLAPPTSAAPATNAFQEALDWGKRQIGKGYIWGSAGGRSDLSGNAPGYDCSGFVSQFYHQMGLSVPAQTASAYAATTHLDASDARPGDIVEFNMNSNDPHEQHIAIYLGNGQILQSGGTRGDVNIGSVNQFGPGTFEFRRAAGADKALGNTTASSTVANTAVTAAATATPSSASDSTPSATTTPSSQPSVLDQAKVFTDNLNNQFQSATSTAGQAKDNVLQQAQAFTDGLNQKFQDASSAASTALPDLGSRLQSPDYANSPIAQQAATGNANPHEVVNQASEGLANTLLPDVPVATGLLAGALNPENLPGGAVSAPLQLGLDAAAPVVKAAGGALLNKGLEALDTVRPPEPALASTQRPLFGRGGVPGGTGAAPTMPAPTQPQDLTTALEQSQVQATLQKIQNMGYSPDEAANLLRSNGVPEEHIQTALNPTAPEQVPTSTRPPTATTATAPPAAPTEPGPSVTVDTHGNVLTGELPPVETTPPQPPQPPTADTLAAEPAPEAQPLRGAAANYTPSRVPNVFNPRSQGPQAVQDAVDSRDALINTARLDASNALRSGAMTQAQSDQMIGQTIGKANQQFQHDILNSQQGVELKSVLAQHASIDSQGQNFVGNPRPAGWVDGASLPGSGLGNVWVSPEVATIVKNTLGDTSNPLTAAPASIVSQIKQFYLNSPFHAIFGAGQATNLGLSRGAPGETVNALARSTFNSLDFTGNAMDRYMVKPSTLSNAHDFVQDGGTLGGLGKLMDIQGGLKVAAARGVVAGGLTGGKTYLDETSQGTPEDQALQDAATKALLAGGLAAAGTAFGPAIFQRQIPTLKLEFYALLKRQGVQGTTAATMMNNIFGGQNLVRMARAQSTQDILRTVTLAPDLWEGIGRTLLGSARNPDNAKFIATTAATSAILLQASNMVASGHPTVATPAMDVDGVQIPAMQGNAPGFELQVEYPRENGVLDHIDILGSQIRGIAQAIGTTAQGNPASAAGTFFTNHLSPLTGIAKDLVQNNNPATGQPITDSGAPPLKQAADQAGFAAGQLVPVAGSSIDKGTAAAGPVGGALEYLTGRNITSETPDQAANKAYYSSKDQALYDGEQWVKAQPEYKSATPASQRSMLDNFKIQQEHYLSEQANRAPLDKGLPPKYRGISDPRQQQAIDDAKVKVDAYDRDPRHSTRPSAEERRMAAHEPTPEYTRVTQARAVSDKGLEQRFQQHFMAP